MCQPLSLSEEEEDDYDDGHSDNNKNDDYIDSEDIDVNDDVERDDQTAPRKRRRITNQASLHLYYAP